MRAEADVWQPIPPDPESITLTGIGSFRATGVGTNQLAKIPGEQGDTFLPNLMWAPTQKLLGKDADDEFRAISIDSATGKLMRPNAGVPTNRSEITNRKTIDELRLYVQAKGLESDPKVRKFMARYFGEISAGRAELPATSETAAHGSAERGNAKRTEADAPTGESSRSLPAAQPVRSGVPVAGEPIAPSNRYSLLAVKRESLGDGKVLVGGRSCGATPVMKEPTGETVDGKAICEMAFYSAGHCFPTESDDRYGGAGDKPKFFQLVVGGKQGNPIKVDLEKAEVRYGPGYAGSYRLTPDENRELHRQEVVSPSDFAAVFFRTGCDYLGDSEIARLAPTHRLPSGESQVYLDPKEAVRVIDRDGKVVSAKFTDRVYDQWRFAPDAAGSPRPGDFGGPIFNSRGELLGSLSRGGPPGSPKPYLTFNPQGVPWIKDLVAYKQQHWIRARANARPVPAVGPMELPAPFPRPAPLNPEQHLAEPILLPPNPEPEMPPAAKPRAPMVSPAAELAPIPKVVDFHIAPGTGASPWNTRENPMIVPIGSTLRIVNDDRIAHTLHTNGEPCPHGDAMRPNGGEYLCGPIKAFDGRLWEHNQFNASFFVKSVSHDEYRRMFMSVAQLPPQPQDGQPPDTTPLPTARQATQILSTKCLGCHMSSAGGPPKFPAFVTNWADWERRLYNPADPQHVSAVQWLAALDNQLSHGSMLTIAARRAQSKGQAFSVNDQNALRAFIAAKSQLHGAAMPGPRVKSPGDPGALSLTDPKKLPMYRRALADVQVTNPAIADLLGNYDIIYDKTGMPSARQRPDSGTSHSRSGIASVDNRSSLTDTMQQLTISPDGTWAKPFDRGFGLGPNDQSFFLMQLPRDARGELIPIATYEDFDPEETRGATKKKTQWTIYPVGTRVAEVITGRYGVQEIRFKEKKVDPRTGKAFWDPDVLKKFATPESLIASVMSVPGWETDPGLTGLVTNARKGGVRAVITTEMGKIFRSPDGVETDTLVGKTIMAPYPATDAVRTLFTDKVMESAKGAPPWGVKAHGLAVGGAGVPVDRAGCFNCHRQAGATLASVFGATPAGAYGNFSGNDGILSFYPQDPSLLSQFGLVEDNRRYRQPFVSRGMLKPLSSLPKGRYLPAEQ